VGDLAITTFADKCPVASAPLSQPATPRGVAAVFGGTTKSTKVPPSESRARGTAPPIQHLAGSQAKIAADLRV